MMVNKIHQLTGKLSGSRLTRGLFNLIVSLIACGPLFLVAGCSSRPPSSGQQGWSWDKPSPLHAKPHPHYKVGAPYTVKGKKYYPQESFTYREEGIASWYGPGFHGRLTANGEVFDSTKATAAHRTLQMPSIAKVTNLANNKSIYVRINDRGPYCNNRLIDLSKRAAQELDFLRQGTARVRVEVVTDISKRLADLAQKGQFPEHLPGMTTSHAEAQHPFVRLARKPRHL